MKKYSEAAKFKGWLDKNEAALELSEKTGTKLSSANALHGALERGVRFVVYIPTGTTDWQNRPIEPGLWELMTEGAVGEPGRLQVEHEINPNVSVQRIDGACVERDGVQRQLPQQLFPSAIPEGCTLGLRREVVEDLAETLNKELAAEKPSKAAEQLNKDIDERERSTYLTLIAALAAEADVSLTGTALEDVTNRFGKRVSRQTAQDKVNQIKEDADLNGWDKELLEAEKKKTQ